jgi:hypothetical protein
MAASDYATRVLVARIAAHARWAKTADRTTVAQKGQQGLRARFEREIDPDGSLSRADRARLDARVDSALKAHMASLSLIAQRKRKRKRTSIRAI